MQIFAGHESGTDPGQPIYDGLVDELGDPKAPIERSKPVLAEPIEPPVPGPDGDPAVGTP